MVEKILITKKTKADQRCYKRTEYEMAGRKK